jgi:hypothetical protein
VTHNLVHSKDGADVDTGVNVGATIQRVKHDTVVALETSIISTLTTTADDDGLLQLLRDQYGSLAGRAEGVDHDLVREDIELLLVLALHVLFAGQTDAVTTGLLEWVADAAREMKGMLARKAHRLMRRAFRTFEAMYLEVT